MMKESVKASYRPEVLGELGAFGGFFAFDTKKYKEPVLVAGTDGVGTKLKLAFMADKRTIRLVRMLLLCALTTFLHRER